MSVAGNVLFERGVKRIFSQIRNKGFYHKISTHFLLPFIDPKFNWIDLVKDYGFITSFKWIKDEPEDPMDLYLVFFNSDLYTLFYTKYSELIDSEIDIEGYVICKFIIEEKWREDVVKIINGKYSKLSPEACSLFNKYYTLPKEYPDSQVEVINSIPYMAINKSSDILPVLENKFGIEITEEDFVDNMEVWTIMNKEEETLDLNNIDLSKYEN